MAAKIIDGKKVAEAVKKDLKKRIPKLGFKPGLAVVLVGDNPASELYVKLKEKASKELGFHFELYRLDKDTDELALLNLIDKLNQDKKIHGMLVQLPLPKQIDEKLIIDAIRPDKDADGLNPINMGNLLGGNNTVIPATPKGVIKLIESTGIKIEGKHAVIVGRSNIVGKPVSVLLQQKNATVTMCHSKTEPLEEYTKQADILVVAAGKPRLITADMVKKGAVVIDVGINKVMGKSIGDVDFDDVKKVAGYITPVPGGVGPMTIAMLLENVLQCIWLQGKLKTELLS